MQRWIYCAVVFNNHQIRSTSTNPRLCTLYKLYLIVSADYSLTPRRAFCSGRTSLIWKLKGVVYSYLAPDLSQLSTLLTHEQNQYGLDAAMQQQISQTSPIVVCKSQHPPWLFDLNFYFAIHLQRSPRPKIMAKACERGKRMLVSQCLHLLSFLVFHY